MAKKKNNKVVNVSEGPDYIEVERAFPNGKYLNCKFDLKNADEFKKQFFLESFEIVMNADQSKLDNIKVTDGHIDIMDLY